MKQERYMSTSLRNLGGRVGRLSSPKFENGSSQGVSMLAKRIAQAGGRTQQERMIRDKRRSLDKALLYSYQGAFVKKAQSLDDAPPPPGETINQPPVRALINPDKLNRIMMIKLFQLVTNMNINQEMYLSGLTLILIG